MDWLSEICQVFLKPKLFHFVKPESDTLLYFKSIQFPPSLEDNQVNIIIYCINVWCFLDYDVFFLNMRERTVGNVPLQVK